MVLNCTFVMWAFSAFSIEFKSARYPPRSISFNRSQNYLAHWAAIRVSTSPSTHVLLFVAVQLIIASPRRLEKAPKTAHARLSGQYVVDASQNQTKESVNYITIVVAYL